MRTAAQRFGDAFSRWIAPGAVYTFVGAGGKTTAMKRLAHLLAAHGIRTRLTTTTKVGIQEFSGYAVSVIDAQEDLDRALADGSPVTLVVAGTMPAKGRYLGLDPVLIEGAALQRDAVLLVEGDGSRGLPIKVPHSHEPVIPRNSSSVFAVIGASAIHEPIDEGHCYNHQKAWAILGTEETCLEPRQIVALAADPEGCRKGILPGMSFRLIVNQGDLGPKREAALEALRMLKERHGISGALVSFQKGELYDCTVD